MTQSPSPEDLADKFEQACLTMDPAVLGRSLYGELHRLAEARMAGLPANNTLQPTALVHEVWLRLRGDEADLRRKRLYFAAAARAMRDILVEQVRSKNRLKRGGGMRPAGETVLAFQVDTGGLAPDDLLALRDALDRLEQRDPRKAEIVLLRFFVGLPQKEIASLLEIAERTVERDWRFAKAWLKAELSDEEPDE